MGGRIAGSFRQSGRSFGWQFLPASARLCRYGAASFAWLAEPKLTLRRRLA